MDRPGNVGWGNDPVTVLIVDDHAAFAEALLVALELEDGLTPAGSAATVDAALAHLEREVPDVILMDIDMPGVDGLEGTRMIKQRHPQVHVLLLTGYTDPRFVELGADAGAVGFLPKQTPIAEIIRAIRTASEGEMLVPASMLATVMRRPPPEQRSTGRYATLTERELEVLTRLGNGKDARDIGKALSIELSTVRGHIKSLLRKLDAHSQLEAVVIAARSGLIDMGPGPKHGS